MPRESGRWTPSTGSGASTLTSVTYGPNSGARSSIGRTRTGGETSITYQNSTTAIKIACSEGFDRLETDIIRLVDGARPPTVVFVSETPNLHKFGLGNLLMIRVPEVWSELKEQKGQSDEAIETQLQSQAKALRDSGSISCAATSALSMRWRLESAR